MNIAILGLGQLGGSLALALKAAQADIILSGYDVDPVHAQALAYTFDRIAATAADAVQNAGIVILAAPLRTYESLARAIAPALAPNAIVTDVGSAKSCVLRLASILPPSRLVPAHPIAGSEHAGPLAARADLFRERLFLLTPAEDAAPAAVAAIEKLWHLLGADVLTMPAFAHDQIYAHVSHLPHLVAFVAADYFSQLGVRADNEMLQRFLRIGRSNARMWTDVALENREALLPALAAYVALLEHFAKELRSGAPAETVPPARAAKRFLPRILAASLVACVSLYEQRSNVSLRAFAGAGMRDVVAPAADAPEGDTEAMSLAAASVADAVDAVLFSFRRLENLIGAEDATELLATLEAMAGAATRVTSGEMIEN